ncbi:SO_0444 family Cu/Zn efflux transporter [Sulfurovum sp. XGS-02]|uniref:SO_0444 family Cu/Zn efflux transporter n=1 Tax=Sulfurovum sp. XGS-02 TaxID=2925411 RepID=UPI00206B2273|nr:SO_0444 family Cu/Zn efflux transporter [Sulfurovum sp. XGS-02]UPT78604.1 SO_0444 family Cu/Zn efflux transporter [Sulfurovum sp. XGS-02]
MEWLEVFFTALIDLSNAMAPYILFGLIFAGILHEVVPDSIVTKHLGKDNVTSVVKSTVFGIPLPVCSCGVIPLATSIKKSGASKGSTLSFLISTPITGVDSIMATYGIFGWIFTLYRVVTSMIIAMFAGILTNIFDKDATTGTQSVKSATPSFSTFAPSKTAATFSLNTPHEESCGTGTGSCCGSSCEENKKFSVMSAMKYAFITLLGDIAKPLFLGLIVGALITVSIPDNIAQLLKDYSWLSYLIVIAIAVPMYVCATASLPIAAGLMLSGVSAGAAFVFLSAGPATNTVTIGVVKKMLGTRSLYIYLGSIIIGSMLFGMGLDYIFDISNINPRSLIHMDEDFGLISILSSLILWGFVLYFLFKPYFKKSECSGGSCCS